MDFESLRAVNSEIVAWLTIDGTNINYPTAQLITPNGSFAIEIFSGYVADMDSDAWQLDFTSNEGFEDWLAAAMEQSAFESTVIPTAVDNIVTLSTCSYEFYNARLVVHGRIISE